MQELFDNIGRKLWSCIECDFQRPGRYDVRRHVEQKHLDLSIPCNYCDTVFTRRDKHKHHLKHKHGIV